MNADISMNTLRTFAASSRPLRPSLRAAKGTEGPQRAQRKFGATPKAN